MCSSRFSVSVKVAVSEWRLSSSFDFSMATETMSNCTCFFVFFCSPLHGLSPMTVTDDAVTGVLDLIGLRSSVVSDAGFFSIDLISADMVVMPQVVNE